MSNKLHSCAHDVDMQSLLEKVRRLEMENKRLKEKSTKGDEASIISASVKIELNANDPKGRIQSQIIEMGNGMRMAVHGELLASNQQISLCCEVASTVDFDTTIIMTHDSYGNKGKSNSFVDFIRASVKSARGSKHVVNVQQRGYHTPISTLTVGIKMIRMAQPISNPSENNATVTVVIQNQKILVDVPYVSKWSQFLPAYFASNMKESASRLYPIKDCSLADFCEMLEIIYPSSKPIDESNVDAMLNLADRFIMPMLTRKCEVFLSKNDSHGISEIRMLEMADRFNLARTRTIVLEGVGSTALLRSKIIEADGYDTLSKEMKIEVDARYVQLDVQERKGR